MGQVQRKHWARWFLVVPAGLAGWLVAAVVTIINIYVADLPDLLAYAINGVFGPAFFVYAGALAAPWARVATSIALASMMTLWTGASMVLIVQRGDGQYPLLLDIAILIASVIATGVAILGTWAQSLDERD